MCGGAVGMGLQHSQLPAVLITFQGLIKVVLVQSSSQADSSGEPVGSSITFTRITQTVLGETQV